MKLIKEFKIYQHRILENTHTVYRVGPSPIRSEKKGE